MHGYDTKEQHETHLKGLVKELGDTQRALVIAEEQLSELSSQHTIVDRAVRELRVGQLKESIQAIQEQVSLFKGEAPNKRASKRSPVETR